MASEYVDVSIPDIFFEMKKIPMFKHAVVAGGWLRNQVLSVKPNDLDIFVPITSESKFYGEFQTNFEELKKLGLSFTDETMVPGIVKSDGGYTHKPDLRIQYNLKGPDGLDIDVMAMRLNVDGFMANLIEGFPFANQQIVTDGKKFIHSEGFDRDIEKDTMTLRLIHNSSELPKLIEKFNKVKALYPNIRFKTDYVLQKRTGDDWL